MSDDYTWNGRGSYKVLSCVLAALFDRLEWWRLTLLFTLFHLVDHERFLQRIRQVLARLCKQGVIRRVRWGVYEKVT